VVGSLRGHGFPCCFDLVIRPLARVLLAGKRLKGGLPSQRDRAVPGWIVPRGGDHGQPRPVGQFPPVLKPAPDPGERSAEIVRIAASCCSRKDRCARLADRAGLRLESDLRDGAGLIGRQRQRNRAPAGW